MTSLFREEALEHHARGARPGEPLRLDDRWPCRLLPVLLGALVLATVAALVVHLPGAGGGSHTVVGALFGRG
jgi:hypothetical protein